MSSGMESTYRHWRRTAARQIKEIKRLARAKKCNEATSLKSELLVESVPSLVGWSSYANLNAYVVRYCPARWKRTKR